MLKIFVSLLGLTVLSHALQTSERLAGGTVADITTYPWLVSVMFKGDHICGGSIISPKLVLTTRSCATKLIPLSYKIRTGSTSSITGGIVHKVKVIIPYPSYNATTMENDLAVIQIKDQFDMTLPGTSKINLSPVPLPANTPVKFAGWGAQTNGGAMETTLRAMTLNMYSNANCQTSYGASTTITSSMVCAKATGKNFCDGDEGGPLVATVAGVSVQIGMASFNKGCSSTNIDLYPGVYTDTTDPILFAFVQGLISQIG